MEGEIHVVVATVAFGMGINKASLTKTNRPETSRLKSEYVGFLACSCQFPAATGFLQPYQFVSHEPLSKYTLSLKEIGIVVSPLSFVGKGPQMSLPHFDNVLFILTTNLTCQL